MKNEEKVIEQVSQSLDVIKYLLQQSVAIQLYQGGATQDEIAKNLKIAKATINQMVKGITKKNLKE